MISECITTVTFSLFINGSPHSLITPSRRLRQGDPLSPFLFILASQVMTKQFQKEMGYELCMGFQQLITLLQYLIFYFSIT